MGGVTQPGRRYGQHRHHLRSWVGMREYVNTSGVDTIECGI